MSAALNKVSLHKIHRMIKERNQRTSRAEEATHAFRNIEQDCTVHVSQRHIPGGSRRTSTEISP